MKTSDLHIISNVVMAKEQKSSQTWTCIHKHMKADMLFLCASLLHSFLFTLSYF